MLRRRTNNRTLYRLIGVDPTTGGMIDAVDLEKADKIGADPIELHHSPVPAMWLSGACDTPEAPWCRDARETTGIPISIGERDSAGLLLIAVDDVPYAIPYGRTGWRLVQDVFKDPRYGLKLAARRLDPEHVKGIVSRRPGARGRTDSVRIPGGLPVWALGIRDQLAIIGRLNGQAIDLDVTFSAKDSRKVRIECGAGLTMRLGLNIHDLIADIRQVARICEEETPIEALRFIDHLRPITYAGTLAELEKNLDTRLGAFDESPPDLVAAVPADLIDSYEDARGYVAKIGSVSLPPTDSLEIGHILQRTRPQAPGNRIKALRNGRITMYSDERCTADIGSASAWKWLEAEASIESRRFFLIDGRWYEIDQAYLESRLEEIQKLFPTTSSVDLVDWSGERTEHSYCEHAQNRRGFLCLDTKLVHSQFLRGGGFEACDVLGPNNELIHVKFARGSDVLSHLFTQGAASAIALWNNADARAGFAELVKRASAGRTIPKDFQPSKVVFAILPKQAKRNGKPVPVQVTASNLFPLAQISLTNVARELLGRGIKVEVIGIPIAEAIDDAA